MTRLIPVIAARMAFINKAKDSHGQFADNFDIAVLTVAHINLNVIVTCLPFIKPVTDSLQTGILASNLCGELSAGHSSHLMKPLGNTSSASAPKGRRLFTPGESKISKNRIPTGQSEERIIVQQEFSVDVSHDS